MTDIPHNPALEWGTDYRGPAFSSIRQVLITAKECLSHEEAANRLLEADRKTGSGGGKNNMVEITVSEDNLLRLSVAEKNTVPFTDSLHLFTF